MYDFDVVFLLLSSPASAHFDDVLRLQDAAAGTGFHTLIATRPEDIPLVAKRFRIIVIDGGQDSGFDAYALTAAMRNWDWTALVFLADATLMAREWGLVAGADICLPRLVSVETFCAALLALANDSSCHAAIDDSGAAPGAWYGR